MHWGSVNRRRGWERAHTPGPGEESGDKGSER
jgi:hypothetical protein